MASQKEGYREKATPTHPSLMFIIVQEIIAKAQEISPFNIDQNFDIIDEINELSKLLEAEAEEKEETEKRIELATPQKTKPKREERPILQFKYRIQDWRKLKKKRKWNFWLYLKNKETSQIYREWYDTKSKILPKKLKPKYGQFRYPGETEVRLRSARELMKHESEIMRLKADDYQRKFEELDQKMLTTIKAKYQQYPDTVHELSALWKEECNHEMIRSKSIWQKKEEWTKKKAYHYTENIEKNEDKDDLIIPAKLKKNKNIKTKKKTSNLQPSKDKEDQKFNFSLEIHQLEREIFEEMEHKLEVERKGEIYDENHLNDLFKTYDQKCAEDYKSTEQIQFRIMQQTKEGKNSKTEEQNGCSKSRRIENQRNTKPEDIPKSESTQTTQSLRQNIENNKNCSANHVKANKNENQPRYHAEANKERKIPRKTQEETPSKLHKSESSDTKEETRNKNDNTLDKRKFTIRGTRTEKKLTFTEQFRDFK